MDKLGIQPSLLLAQIVNFLIIMVVLKVLLYKPILSMLEKRKKKIEEGLALTESLEKEKEKLEVKKNSVLADARNVGQAIIDEAKKEAKKEGKLLVEEAQKEAEAVLLKGKETIEREREAMQKGLQKQSVALAVAMTQRLLQKSMTTETHHALLKKHISEIEKL